MTRGALLAQVPVLPTTVVGSYPVPDWMERLKTDYFRGRMSHAQLADVRQQRAVHPVDHGTVVLARAAEVRPVAL